MLMDRRYTKVSRKEFDKEDGHHLNNWRVLWTKRGKLYFHDFLGDKPTKAVEFAKRLKRHGLSVDIISTRHAFAPRGEPPSFDYMWCPYCIKWRQFELIIRNSLGIQAPAANCCPTCYISDRDAYVRKYNPEIVARREIALELRARMREVAKKKKEERQERGTRARRAHRR